jgi:hypothetical protein
VSWGDGGMLALAAADVAGAVLFGALYTVAGLELMTQGAFLASLAVMFILVTTLWIRAEGRHRALPVPRRALRVVGGLAIAFVATPGLSLMPLFWLDTQLPPEAGLRGVLAPTMAVLLIALVLVVLVNVAGAAVIVGRALLPRGIRAARRP